MTQLFDELGRPVRRTAAVVRHIELQKTGPVAAGTREQDDFIVPIGRSWLGRHATFSAPPPPGATTGSVGIRILIPSPIREQSVVAIDPAFNAHAATETNISQVAVAAGRILRFNFTNNTNAAQTNSRNWHITVIEEMN
jgi:hypothetical protein